MTLLVVEDDPGMAQVLRETLEREGHTIELVQDGEAAIEAASSKSFSAIVLDVLLPVFSGFEVCQRLREEGVLTPILMLTCRDHHSDVIRGLKVGADDYMTKPFISGELTARIGALIRRASGYHQSRKLRVADLVLDSTRREVMRDGERLPLTRREFDLLEYLMRHKDHALQRADILEKVWGGDGEHTLNIVDVYIGYLRKKIDLGENKPLIHTVHGFGFKISED